MSSTQQVRKSIDEDPDVDIFEEDSIEYVPTPHISYEKLSKYFRIIYKIKHVQDKDIHFYEADFRHCSYKDFERNGLSNALENEHMLEERLCPKTEDIEELLKVKNLYSNE